MASDGNSTLIELSAAGGMYHFALSPNLLMDLLLTALKARTNWDQIKAPGAARATVPPCDKWEIRTLNKGRFLVFGFRHPSGAWVRLKVSQAGATSMRETLDAIEGRPMQLPLARRAPN